MAVFLNRTELFLPNDTHETLQQTRQQEAAIIQQDKSCTDPKTGGLFKGVFRRSLGRPVRDEEDGVDRCPICHWEIEDGECPGCGNIFDGEFDGDGFSDLDEDFDAVEADFHDEDDWDHDGVLAHAYTFNQASRNTRRGVRQHARRAAAHRSNAGTGPNPARATLPSTYTPEFEERSASAPLWETFRSYDSDGEPRLTHVPGMPRHTHFSGPPYPWDFETQSEDDMSEDDDGSLTSGFIDDDPDSSLAGREPEARGHPPSTRRIARRRVIDSDSSSDDDNAEPEDDGDEDEEQGDAHAEEVTLAVQDERDGTSASESEAFGGSTDAQTSDDDEDDGYATATDHQGTGWSTLANADAGYDSEDLTEDNTYGTYDDSDSDDTTIG